MNNKAKQIVAVKNMIQLLNTELDKGSKKIPTVKLVNGRYVNCHVNPPNIFTAVQNPNKDLDHWFFNCTDYSVWSSDEFNQYRDGFNELAAELGFRICFCYCFLVGAVADMERAKNDCRVTIGRYYPIVTEQR